MTVVEDVKYLKGRYFNINIALDKSLTPVASYSFLAPYKGDGAYYYNMYVMSVTLENKKTSGYYLVSNNSYKQDKVTKPTFLVLSNVFFIKDSQTKATGAELSSKKSVKAEVIPTDESFWDKVKKTVTDIGDSMSSFHVSYNQVPGFTLGIQNLSIILLYPTGQTAQADLITNGAGQIQLISGVSGGGSSSFFSSTDYSTSSELYFSLNVIGSSLAVSTQESVTTTSSASASDFANAYSNNTYVNNSYSSNTQNINIGSTTIPLINPPAGQPTHYQVIINGKTTSTTPLSREFYIVAS